MFCTRSRKKILDGANFFDPAPPATGYQEREMDPLRSRSAPPIRRAESDREPVQKMINQAHRHTIGQQRYKHKNCRRYS
jgi:hypothetical protein